jgi:hypothetical protein
MKICFRRTQTYGSDKSNKCGGFAEPSPTGRKPGTLARLARHPIKGGAKGRDDGKKDS